eukprot:TRINITY_DN626_c0_g1_i1.p1 TRINITY_DN626_c0_g1~~TRINITY_DN626_c0_g1_i1.p1  ORF type:complete len:474 (-),score=141.29 TRINITY_DN626_c0_g1_i1:195-1616(-)
MGNETSTAKGAKDLQEQMQMLDKSGIPSTCLMSESDYHKLQKQVAFEYPGIVDVSESLLVADNRLRDCPIVYCNDHFERMTKYPKEKSLGINCRFLQGPLTDQAVVKKIGEAVRDGQALDVELLNYRLDGVPFWNSFVMLPVHAFGKKEGKVNFFLAIQKDVSLITGLRKEASAWSAPEVCMWLERTGLGHLAHNFLSHRVEGVRLLSGLTDDKLLAIGIHNKKDRQSVLAKIQSEFSDGGQYLDSDVYSGETHSGSDETITTSRTTVRQRVLANGESMGKWGLQSGINDERLAVKCTRGERDHIVMHVEEKNTTSVQRFVRVLNKRLGCIHRYWFEDVEGDRYELDSDEILESALILTGRDVLRLYCEEPKPLEVNSLMDYVNVPIFCVDAFDEIRSANNYATALYRGEVVGRLITEVVDRELKHTVRLGGRTLALSCKKKYGRTASVQLAKAGLAVVTVHVPHSVGKDSDE